MADNNSGFNADFLDDFYNQIIDGVSKYTETAYGNLVAVMAPALIAVVTLYIVIQGIRIFMGYNETSVSNFAKKALLLGFVTVLATNWEVFTDLIVDTVMYTPQHLINALITDGGGESGQASTREFFSKFLSKSMAIFIQVFKEGGITNAGPYVIGLMGIIAVAILVAAVFILLITSQVTMSLLLILAPFIIPMYLFESSRNICMSWVRMLITAMFVPILVYVVTGLFMSILNDQLEMLKADEMDMFDIIAYVITVVICVVLVRQVPALASGIGGGVTNASAGPSPMPMLKSGFNGVMKTMDSHFKKQLSSMKQDGLDKKVQYEMLKNKNNTEAANTLITLDTTLPVSKLKGYGR